MALDYVFTPVKIDQSAAAGVTEVQAAAANKVPRLHYLFGTFDVAGTLIIEDSDGTALTGAMYFLAGEQVKIDCQPAYTQVKGPESKGLQINTSQKFNGFAVVSLSDI